MIDKYALATIVLRSIAVVLLLRVFRRQIILYRYKDDRQFKLIFMALVVIVVLGNLLSITLNIFRTDDGSLLGFARHVSMIWNGLSAISMGVLLTLIYKGDK